MSIKLMTHVWEHSQQRGAARLLLLALADNANDEGYCYPSQAQLAKKCAIDVRTVQKLTKELERSGEVEVVEEADTGGRRSAAYMIRCICHSRQETGRTPGRRPGGTPGERPGGLPARDTNPPAPPLKDEPSEKPSEEKRAASPLAPFFESLYPLLPPGYDKERFGREVKRLITRGVDPEQSLAFKQWFEGTKFRGGEITLQSAPTVAKYWGEYLAYKKGETAADVPSPATTDALGMTVEEEWERATAFSDWWSKRNASREESLAKEQLEIVGGENYVGIREAVKQRMAARGRAARGEGAAPRDDGGAADPRSDLAGQPGAHAGE